ncbi:tannase/feruloyl esterase family alpha/beta hydrolase [Streptomyces shenzhenensis]|uniref:tannase/feruloyl esterase family alpha/beta hydrolase n=1 Tax=Streptomyces shenzhenensis TaxID=943815 RepID=UPI002868081B|nr:tannase/feruloyl esterase family alpha/beta hydrolase [Streptomyces shenzhenensis]
MIDGSPSSVLALPGRMPLGSPHASARALASGGPAVLADPGPLADPPACAAPSVKAPSGAEVESVTAIRQDGGTLHGTGLLGGEVSGVPAFCRVTVAITHPGDNDHAKVQTWLPLTKWKGRFQAIGGSAYSTGDNGVGLGTAVKNGYAAFLAPNTAHRGLNGLDGSADGLAALTSWVEHGKAPQTLPATLINADGKQVEHDLCGYPAVSRCKGDGDLALASGFRCVSPSRH